MSAQEVRSLQVRPWADRDRVIVAVIGELDIASVSVLGQALDDIRGAGCSDVVLDLRGLSFIDACGLNLLLRADRAARRAGKALATVDDSPAVARVLELAELQNHFNRAQVR